jgi:hypothetical protein
MSAPSRMSRVDGRSERALAEQGDGDVDGRGHRRTIAASAGRDVLQTLADEALELRPLGAMLERPAQVGRLRLTLLLDGVTQVLVGDVAGEPA